MVGFARLLDRMPLRRRFLVAPLLGLLLIILVTAGLIAESQRQNALVTRIATEDLAELDRYMGFFVVLSEQHAALFDLLHDAQRRIDEETLYDRAKQRLDNIRSAVANLEQALLAGPAAGNGSRAGALRGELITRTREYRVAALSAVELATVDLAVAGARLVAANGRFVSMNRAFTAFLDAKRQQIGEETAESVRQIRWNNAVIAVVSVSLALVLVMVSYAFSRLLTRSLEGQLRALTELGEQAGARAGSERGADEIARIADAIAAFRDSLLSLKEHERALSEANRGLQRARDELELRVEERTRELSSANVELSIYREVVRSTGETVVITTPDGIIVEVNPAFERVTGYAREEVIGTRLYQHAAGLNADDVIRELWHSLRTEGNWNGELLDRRKNGEAFPAWVTINAVRGNRGETVHLVSVSRDITALKRSEQQLQKLAFYDPLTALANRALFDDRLKVALAGARRNQTMLAVMFIDLDRFKYVNDTLGHPAGDQLLIEVASRLSALVRATDTIARLGGDEFTILLATLNAENDAIRIAERVIDAVGKPVVLGGETVFVGASVGVSFYPKDGENADVLRKHADVALYEAKQAGRGQHFAFSPAMLAKANERLSLSVQIDSALQNDEFTLLYQPVIDMDTGRANEVEALIRWRRQDGSLIEPAMFIPHAEEAGLMKRIDLWVLERACREVSEWSRMLGHPLRLSVNLSPVTLQQPDIPKQIKGILDATGFAPRLLNLELTETAVIANRHVAGAVLKEISALGVSIALDDFGIGYSSLNYLAGYPIDCIKLDRSFVHRIGKDGTSEAIIRSLLQLAASLKIKVIAEGVEEKSQQDFLHTNGCHLAQGYRYSRPMRGEALLSLLGSDQVVAQE